MKKKNLDGSSGLNCRMKLSKNRWLFIKILKKNEKIYNEQKKLVNRYSDLAKKQQNQEFWIKATRYIAFPFIIVRVIYFCYINIF